MKKIKHSNKKQRNLKKNKKSSFTNLEFWKRNPVNQKFIIDPAKLTDFLEANNFYCINYFGTQLVAKVENNIAKTFTATDVFNLTLTYIKEQDNDDLRSQFIKDGEILLISKKAILCSLQVLQLQRFNDTKDSSILFFENAFVTINKQGYSINSYSYLSTAIDGHYIFESQIIRREIVPTKRFKKSQFYEFLKLSTNDKTHFNNVITSIGYLLHKYKNPSVAKAVILSDILSQATNTPNGRSGKGLIIKAIEEVLNIVEYNGKNLDLSKDKFVFQSITPQTDLFVLQDVQQSFSFEALFAVITDKMNIERKHQNKMTLDFDCSPKIAVTTNYTLSDKGGSHTDRKHLVLLNNYFNSTNRPDKHFKNLFFIEWDDDEYQRFYSFMIYCLKKYFKSGLITYDSPELRLQKLEVQTSENFVKMMDKTYAKSNNYFPLKEVAAALGDDITIKDEIMRSKTVSDWISLYANYKGYKIDKRISGGLTKMGFVKKK